MDDVRPAAPAARRTGSLLALALLASTALSALTPTATSSAPLLEVVVMSTGAGVEAAADAVRAAGGTVRDALPLVGGVSGQLPEGAVLAPAFRVVQDYPITLAGRKGPGNGQPREATAVREALGLGPADGQGAGIRVAVIDTGVADHADLAGRLEHHPIDEAWRQGPADPYGHGTFVAGVLAGDGSASGGRYAGVAPGATVLDVRVADDAGETDLSSVLLGVETAHAAGAHVVNLSLSSGSPLPYQLDPLAVALTSLWTKGVVVVVPTGNDGPSRGSVTSPGSDPTLLTVGALDEQLTADRSDDVVPAFSGRGPAPQDVAKPDLVAPGRSLVSLSAAGSAVAAANPDALLAGGYFRGSGTSFATAAVAGTAALLLEERPTVGPDQVKALLTGTAYSAKGLKDVRDAGAGGLDVAAALDAQPPTVTPAADQAPPTGEADTAAWHAFLQALMDGDRVAAAAAWQELSPAAHAWAANSWSAHKWGAHKWGAHKWGAHKWGANSWSAHKWAGADGTAEEWEARSWAAHTWAAHTWAGDSFVAHKWAAHTWAGDPDFAAHKWAAHKWAAHKWAAHAWSASTWS